MLLRRGFWFLRHGQTDWNREYRAQGRVEVPLNAHGLDQARQAAALLKDRGIATIRSSPLSRARVTAEIVGAEIGVAVQIHEPLIECAFGTREGAVMAAWFDGWIAGEVELDGGESFVQLRRRAAAAVNDCLAQPVPVLVVAHGALMRALRAEMNLPVGVRTANAVPIWCEPPDADGRPWTLEALEPVVTHL